MGRLDDTLETMPYQIRKMYYIGLRKKCIEKQSIMMVFYHRIPGDGGMTNLPDLIFP